MTNYVTYFRVSTDAQGRSGLGLEAQQTAVDMYVAWRPGAVVGSFTEVESGKRHENRPQLARALALCRAQGAILLIAKLDRLARNVHFISGLMESPVKFVACDMPDADAFRLHIEAAVAEEERRKIARRTKEALAAAKARGVKLGVTQPLAVRGLQDKADQRARALEPHILELRAAGVTTLKGIAEALSKRLGKKFYPTQITRITERLAA